MMSPGYDRGQNLHWPDEHEPKTCRRWDEKVKPYDYFCTNDIFPCAWQAWR